MTLMGTQEITLPVLMLDREGSDEILSFSCSAVSCYINQAQHKLMNSKTGKSNWHLRLNDAEGLYKKTKTQNKRKKSYRNNGPRRRRKDCQICCKHNTKQNKTLGKKNTSWPPVQSVNTLFHPFIHHSNPPLAHLNPSFYPVLQQVQPSISIHLFLQASSIHPSFHFSSHPSLPILPPPSAQPNPSILQPAHLNPSILLFHHHLNVSTYPYLFISPFNSIFPQLIHPSCSNLLPHTNTHLMQCLHTLLQLLFHIGQLGILGQLLFTQLHLLL